jgi:electron transport complex protein RnfC
MSPMQLLHKNSFSHGVHLPEYKEITEDKAIRRMPFAPEMVIQLSQHLGAPAKAIVREGQEVVRGEPIATAGGFVSVPMHAPASGVVKSIMPTANVRGQMVPSIVLSVYSGASQEVLYGAPQNIDELNSPETIQAVQDTGMVGLGGAAFPTHVKMSVPEGKLVDTILVNGCECEPFLTCDHRVMLEKMDQIIVGIRLAVRAVEAPLVIIGIEDNKPDAIEALTKAFAACPESSDYTIRVQALPTKYPQGAEKMLAKALVNREIPSGGLPSDAGLSVFNIATLAQIGELVPQRQGLIERVITVTGHGVRKPGNYLVPLGTPLRYVLEYVGLTEDAREVILGGPMMGPAVASFDIPITKGVSGILVRTEDELAGESDKVYPCIQCAQCLQACPMHLNPSRLGILARKRQYDVMESEFHLNDCFECGCCTFVCSSNIPLVQYFRIAKGINRERKTQ